VSSSDQPGPDTQPEVAHHADGTVDPTPTAQTPTVPAAEVRTVEREHEHPAPAIPEMRAVLPPTLVLLLGIAGAVVAIGGMRSVASIIAPTFLAITLIIAVFPIYRALSTVLPKALGAVVMLLLLYGILALLVGSLGLAAGKLATELPKYTDTFDKLVGDGQDALIGWGITQDQIDNAMSGFEIKDLTGIARSLANTLGSLTTSMLFLLTVMLFLTMDAGGFPKRLRSVHRAKPDIADALADFGERVRKYWVVSTLFGLIVAVIDSIALMILDVPLPLTFGLLAFVTNYIPNIGFVIGLVPPALLALLDGGVEKMIWVVVVYSVANFVIQTVLQPKFTGDAVGINATTAFLSLIFWSYVFGALGALLAIPFTLLVKSVLIDRDPKARWLNQFIASAPDEKRSAQPV
jgi:AI-2 transport protein TqsA